jgi:hypothetical protein
VIHSEDASNVRRRQFAIDYGACNLWEIASDVGLDTSFHNVSDWKGISEIEGY